jgi:hypothetical protein
MKQSANDHDEFTGRIANLKRVANRRVIAECLLQLPSEWAAFMGLLGIEVLEGVRSLTQSSERFALERNYLSAYSARFRDVPHCARASPLASPLVSAMRSIAVTYFICRTSSNAVSSG